MGVQNEITAKFGVGQCCKGRKMWECGKVWTDDPDDPHGLSKAFFPENEAGKGGSKWKPCCTAAFCGVGEGVAGLWSGFAAWEGQWGQGDPSTHRHQTLPQQPQDCKKKAMAPKDEEVEHSARTILLKLPIPSWAVCVCNTMPSRREM